MKRVGLLLLATGLALLPPVRGQDGGEAPAPPAGAAELGQADDPFAAPSPPAPDDLGQAPDPFAAPSPPAPTAPAPFDPDAVSLARETEGLQLHGRANGTLAVNEGEEPVELMEDEDLRLSSLDLYAEWIPCRWFAILGEVELTSELEDDRRKTEVEPELCLAEVRPLGDERLRLRAGMQPVPFGLERRSYAPSRNLLANRPAAFRRVYPGSYVDTGGFLWLRQPFGSWGGELDLEAGISFGLNGPEREDRPDPFSRDKNHEPQLSGRLGWTLFTGEPGARSAQGLALPTPIPVRLTLGASALWGHYSRDRRQRVQILGADGELVIAGLELRAEVVDTRFEAPAGPPLRGRGLYVQAAWRLHPELFLLDEVWIAFRYDRIDPDRAVDAPLDLERYHFGLGWLPHHGIVFKIGYEIATGRSDPEDTLYLEVGFFF